MVDEKTTASVRRKYNRVARFYDMRFMKMDDRLHKEIWKYARGKVLEVGVGTGKNIPFYPKDVEVTAIDFSEKMLEKAVKKRDELGAKVDLRLMDAQKMDFPDRTFDTVITTCVFCTVPDPVAGLREIRRVCKPDGQVVMLEHVRSCRPVLGALMDWLNPLVYGLIGTNINRNTVENVKKAGLTVTRVEKLWGDILLKIIARP
ncbi:MAG: class I SAM-dependent methyltransferase [Firmicutes bacterium]|nr:class I SAM-dependent methyltransferase [Bacillota bacterium]